MPKLGKVCVSYGTLRQWNVMLLLKELSLHILLIHKSAM